MIRCYIAEGVRGDRSLCDTVNSDVGDLITRIGSYGKSLASPVCYTDRTSRSNGAAGSCCCCDGIGTGCERGGNGVIRCYIAKSVRTDCPN